MSGTVVPAIIAARMRRYKEAFRIAGATAPGRAMRPVDIGLRESLAFYKLVRQSVLVAVGNGRYYLDEVRAAAVMRTKRKILAVLLFLILIGLVIGAITTSTT